MNRQISSVLLLLVALISPVFAETKSPIQERADRFLALANAGYSPATRARKSVIAASVREVARWLGDTPSVTRGSYIDPRLIARYEAEGQLTTIPDLPPRPPAPREAEIAVSGLLAAYDDTGSPP